jgi:hypothetical protein
MNKDLDLPTQKEMLAMYRCEEILNEVYAEFAKKLSTLKAPLSQGQLVENFGSVATKLVDECLGMSFTIPFFPLVSNVFNTMSSLSNIFINFVHLQYCSRIRQSSKKISRRSEQKKAKAFIGEIECRSFCHFSTTNESKIHTLHKSHNSIHVRLQRSRRLTKLKFL